MDDGVIAGRIRPIAICVFRDGSRILVGDGHDTVKDEVFYRPAGGGIHFGEDSLDAMRREMREELGVDVGEPRLIGVLENRFTCDGKPGHEIVFVYDGKLGDPSLYEVASFKGQESDGQTFNALWLDIDDIGPDTPPVYPDGLVELLQADERPAPS